MTDDGAALPTFRLFTGAEQRAYRGMGEAHAIFLTAAQYLGARTGAPDDRGVEGLLALERLDAHIDTLSRVLATSVIESPVRERDLRAALADVNRSANRALSVARLFRDDVRFEIPRDVRARQAALMLQRAGLEDHGCVMVTATRQGKMGAAYDHYPETTVARGLVPHIYDRAQVYATLDPLPWLEMRACSWFFDCYSPVVHGSDPGTRRIRKQELLLIDRPSIAYGASMLRAFLDLTPTLDSSPRQLRVAEALLSTVPGIFRQMSAEGRRTTVERIGDGRRFEFRADSEAFTIGPAYIGRLMQVGDDFAFTPGFCRFGGVPLEPVEPRAREVIGASPPCYPAIALEMARADLYRVDVPIMAPGSQSFGESESLCEMVEDLISRGELTRPAELSDLTGAALRAPARAADSGEAARPDSVFTFWCALIRGEADEEGSRSGPADN